MNRVLIALLLSLFTLPGWAQEEKPEPWYEVEIILFENLDPKAADSEKWPLDIGEPDTTDSIQLLRTPPQVEVAESVSTKTNQTQLQSAPTPASSTAISVEMPVPYLILPPEQYQLNDAYQKLVNSANYLPLLHVAWRQIIPPREKPDHIFIHDQLNEPVGPEVIQEEGALAQENVEMPAPSPNDFNADMFIESPLESMPPSYTLSGILSIGVGRYLHVDADLLLYKPQPKNEPLENEAPPPIITELEPPQPFTDEQTVEPNAEPVVEREKTPEFSRIRGNLRMRSGDVHYLDHPLVGMLILFTPYTPPEPEVTDELTGDKTETEEHIDVNQTGMSPSVQ